jgi:uncharacterized protein (TIGR02231 family)
MRIAAFALILFPLPALTETITLDAPPVAVTAYASGAVVTRQASFDIPAGQHSLRIVDMDPNTSPEAFDISLAGAVITSRHWSTDTGQPYRAPRTPAWQAAKAQLDAANAALAQLDDQIALAMSRGQAAQDQIDFLNGITLPDEAATDVDTLRAIGQLIASDGTAARGAIRASEAEARALRLGRDDLVFAVQQAQAALRDATPPNENPATLTFNVTAAQAGPAELQLRYLSNAVGWAPTYTLSLSDDENLSVERGAAITQYSAEDWTDVALTLSTLSPFQGSEPGTLWPLLRRIEEPGQVIAKRSRSELELNSLGAADSMAPAPMVMEESAPTVAAAAFSGVGVTYTLPGTVSVPAGHEAVQIALDTLSFDATLLARAVPRINATAFRQVTFENTSPEILLPGQAVLFVDGHLIGTTRLDILPPNAEADIFFGPIEGLRLTRTVLDRNERDRGIISRSNQEREAIRLEVENLTDRTWKIALRESVPYSEQEDLVIEWTATPAPDVEAVDDRRGILEWRIELAPGDTESIELETELEWPEGMILR